MGNNREFVSAGQMAVLLLTFITGSAVVYIPSPAVAAAHNGVWLSFLLSGAAGALVLGGVLYLHRRYPGVSFIGCLRDIGGGWLATLFIIPYTLTLLLMMELIVRGLGTFFNSTMMRATPSYVFHFFVMLLSALIVRAGVEVMARMFAPLIAVIFVISAIVLLLAIHDYQPQYLLPLAPKGIKPIFHGAYFLYGFPYAEIFLFTTLLGFVKQEKADAFARAAYGMLLLNVSLLATISVCSIMEMSLLTEERKYALFDIARVVEIGGVVERIESFVGIAIISGSIMKVSIALLSLNVSIGDWLRLRETNAPIAPLSAIVFFLSLTLFPGEPRFVEVFTVVWPLLLTLVFLLPLCFTVAAVFVKTRMRR